MSYIDILLFLIGIASTAKINFGGELYGSDILLAFLLLLLAMRVPRLFQSGYCRLILFLGALWTLNLIATDIWRQTPFEDLSRGWAKNLSFLINLCGLVVLLESRYERIVFAIAGSAFATLLQAIFFPIEYQISDPWKFGYGPSLGMLAAIMGMTRASWQIFGFLGEILPLTVLGIADLAFGARSAFGLAIGAVAFGILKRAIDLRPRFRARLRPVSFVLVLGGGMAFAQGLITIYSNAAESGLLGLDAKDKYENQASGSLNLFLGGRGESLISIQAILDSPIIGHGSWAQDTYYVSLLVEMMESNGIELTGDQFQNAYIPTHSHLAAAWVEGGIFGGVFWLAIIVLALMSLYLSLKVVYLPGTFIAFVLFSMLWDMLFSPFGATQRFIKAAEICVILWVLLHSRKKTASLGGNVSVPI